MKTKTFKQIIDRVTEKGADCIIIKRATSYCGCIKPDDIITVVVRKGDDVYIASVSHVTGKPIIYVYKLVWNKESGNIYRKIIGQYNYAL